MKPIAWIALLILPGLMATSFAQQSKGGASMALTSSAFAAGAAIPQPYTCKGSDMSPAVEWSGSPANAISFAMIMDDPDAPAGTWVHWVLWNVSAQVHSLPQAEPTREQLDDGSRQGKNSFGRIGYNGPCPPGGQTHRYFFRLYAIDTKLNLAAGATRDQLDAAMKGHILAQAEYMGIFHK